jgi:hypothetical protein
MFLSLFVLVCPADTHLRQPLTLLLLHVLHVLHVLHGGHAHPIPASHVPDLLLCLREMRHELPYPPHL